MFIKLHNASMNIYHLYVTSEVINVHESLIQHADCSFHFSHILFCNAFVILLNQKVISSSASVADVDLEVLRQRG